MPTNRPESKQGLGKREPLKEVNDLPSPAQELLRQMLVEGATYDDVVEAVKERHNQKITLTAVEHYFRSDLGLQKDRVRHQVKIARELKDSLADAQSDHAELAEAVLFAGLMGLRRGTAAADFQTALRVKNRHEDLKMKWGAFQLKTEQADLGKKVARVRLKSEKTKQKLLTRELQKVERAIQEGMKGHKLGSETIKRIHEIYGLVAETPGS